MNANELAEDLEGAKLVILKLNEMLHQQQAELDRAVELYTDKAIENEALKQIIDANNLNQNIGQFVKPINEPVAWMREDGVIAFHKQKEVDSQGYKWIPLYAHPFNNNEPVGKVVQYDKNGSLEHAWFGEPPPVGTLLYTHPVKLTDELNNLKKENKFFKEILSEMDKQVYNIEFLKQPMQILEDGQIVHVFKELTDEEILSVLGDPKECNFLDVDGWEIHNVEWVDFARAILRKASEK